MNQQQLLQPLNTYFKLMTFNGAAMVFQLSQKFGILKILSSGPKTVSQISELSQMQAEPCGLLLQCLASMDLIKQSEGLYELEPVSQFLAGNYENLGQDYWNHLPVFLKTAAPIKKMDTIESSENEYKNQVQSLDWMMKPSSMWFVQKLLLQERKTNLKILDLGAGSGVWSLEILKNDPTSEATLVDWAQVLDVAKGSAQKAGVLNRVQFQSGNYHELEFGKEQYDLVILGNVTHLENSGSLHNLLSKARTALKMGGQVAILDVFHSQDEGKLSASLYALGLALRTEKGRLHTEVSLANGLNEAGFSETKFEPIPVTPFTMGLIRGFKT